MGRDNRIPKDFPLENVAAMKKTHSGIATAALEKEDSILICMWLDSNVVSVVSIAHGLQPMARKDDCQKAIAKSPGPSTSSDSRSSHVHIRYDRLDHFVEPISKCK
ncbi:unnamed protein product [Nezara viridula]|uniref:Uncharacterized protein n=1 Tax=Nezara viridula TaxID=85310 RepID=A0A9P0ECJ5_NEZVI|nr:unnamed protein product [Nezara viridula]